MDWGDVGVSVGRWRGECGEMAGQCGEMAG